MSNRVYKEWHPAKDNPPNDEPFDSFPILNPHVEANASTVAGGRVMNFLGWEREDVFFDIDIA